MTEIEELADELAEELTPEEMYRIVVRWAGEDDEITPEELAGEVSPEAFAGDEKGQYRKYLSGGDSALRESRRRKKILGLERRPGE